MGKRLYRPFDGTEDAVTEPGQAEVDLQPAGRLRVIIGLEAVFEGRILEPPSASELPNLTEAGAFLKYVVRSGVLQDKPGPSIATEFGVLYPETDGDSHFGASWRASSCSAGIGGTVHFKRTSLTFTRARVPRVRRHDAHRARAKNAE